MSVQCSGGFSFIGGTDGVDVRIRRRRKRAEEDEGGGDCLFLRDKLMTKLNIKWGKKDAGLLTDKNDMEKK